jgi:hypothetical protein
VTRFSISRVLLAGLLVFALFVAPIGFSGSVDAAEPHTHSSMGSDSGSGHDGHDGSGHGLIHCGSFSCAPSYVAGAAIGFVSRSISSLVHLSAGDDPSLFSLYLDCDPPIPRCDFSLI